MMSRNRAFAIAGIVMLAFLVPHRAVACGTALRHGLDPAVVSEESAVIVWNADTKTESFIRSATFQTSADDLGFLVPTPTTPTMTEADPAALMTLAKTVVPVTLYGTVFRTIPVSILFFQFFGSTAGSKLAKVGSVDVLAEQQVAGMDVATLAADDPHALGNWIKSHGYGWSPQLEAWVRPYIAKGWKINAFRYVKSDQSTDAISSKLVNMTFQTDTPYFPYSEPQSTSTATGRTLRVFFLSSSREDGTLAPNAKNVTWPDVVDYASPLPANQLTEIAGQLNVDAARLPTGTWLTAFLDKSNPRPGIADVTFSASTDTSMLIPPVVDNRLFENYPFPVEIVTVPLCLILWFVGHCLPRRPRRAMLVTSIGIVGGNIGMIVGNVAALVIGGSLGWRIWHDSPLATMVVVVVICTVVGLAIGVRRGLTRVN